MPGDVQLDEAPAALLAAARRTVPGWLRRITTQACVRGGVDPSTFAVDVDRTVDVASEAALERLAELLATDVDRQQTTPLSVLRDATTPVSDLLRAHRVAPPTPTDPGADEFQLEPATWSDVDPALHEPGLTWGAWKAMTVLARRRDDGGR